MNVPEYDEVIVRVPRILEGLCSGPECEDVALERGDRIWWDSGSGPMHGRFFTERYAAGVQALMARPEFASHGALTIEGAWARCSSCGLVVKARADGEDVTVIVAGEVPFTMWLMGFRPYQQQWLGPEVNWARSNLEIVPWWVIRGERRSGPFPRVIVGDVGHDFFTF